MKRMMRAGLVLAALSLTGCSAYDGWKYRSGPNVELQADDIRVAVDAQLEVMRQFKRSAAGGQDSGLPASWQQVALAGYNYVDSRCEAYLHELVMLELTRDRSNTAFDRVDKATSAITAISGSSGLAIAVLAQSFGFAKEMFNVTLNGYLYNTKAATVTAKVHEMMALYRSDAKKATFTGEQDAYASIRGYLNLCLPATIESNLSEPVAKSSATLKKKENGDTPAPSTTPQVTLSATE